MRYTYLTLLVYFVFTISVVAQEFVYGDPATKKYYSINCAERAKIELGKARGFKSPQTAEEAGFTRGEKCTAIQSTITPMASPSKTGTARPRSSAKTETFDTRDSVSIEQMEIDIQRYKGQKLTFIGEIAISDVFQDAFENYQTRWWEFRLTDYSDHGYFFMPKTLESDAMRTLIASKNRDREYELVFECEVKPMGIHVFSNAKQVWGEIVSCKAAASK